MSDIRAALAQLDRRLSDLRREIASIASEPEATGAPVSAAPEERPVTGRPAPPAWTPSAQTPGTIPRASHAEDDLPASIPAFVPPPPPRYEAPPVSEPLVGMAAQDPRPPEPQGPSSATAASQRLGPAPGPAAPDVGLAMTGSNKSHEIVGRAEAEAARLLAQAHERLDELEAQIEQLLGVRDRLLLSARDLVEQYEEELSRLELRYPSGSATAELAEPLSALAAARQPRPPSGPAQRPAEPLAASAYPAGVPPPAGHTRPATASAQMPPAPGPEPSPAPRPAQFEGIVTVIVPWVSRVQTIQVMKDSLSRVKGAQLAYVRGYHQGEVRFELELGEAVDLIGELNRVLPYAFAIESARQDEIVIRLERAEGSGGGSVD
ncbi:MAG TPA: hypothetical protein VGY32_02055 [Solirubrobacteraceae bacterium]|nr:hypothetical protein [Solirubrobacteraceae bacterium]